MESEIKAARREKILIAAERLFLQQGFKATTMEGIAAEVRMSKATVYAYHHDKDDLFTAVTRRLVGELNSDMRSAFDSDGPAQDLIANALVAKYRLIFSKIRSSAHSNELVAARDSMLSELFDELDRDTRKLIMECLQGEGMVIGKAKSIARILQAASQGIAKKAGSLDEFEKDIRVLSSALVPWHESAR
jgi:AcrR family transcriptional regulator